MPGKGDKKHSKITVRNSIFRAEENILLKNNNYFSGALS